MSSPQPAVLAPAERLPALRAQLKRQGLDGFVIPLSDEHQGEYVPERAQRLRWLTGFSGSAGLVVVLGESAAIFVDGRYTLQAKTEVDGTLFARHHSGTQTPEDWIGGHLGAAMTLGYDAWLHTPNAVKRLREACAKAGGNLQACAANPIDAVWSDQPPPPRAPVVGYGLEFAGVSAEEKRRSVAANLDGASACVLSAPDSIAWLLNVRGGDVPYSPLPLSFAILRADGCVDWFIDPHKTSSELVRHVGSDVNLRPVDELATAIDAAAAGKNLIRVDPATSPSWIFDRVAAAGGAIARGPDPCALPKSCKNPVELEGARAAHVRDGAALTRFLAWLSREAPDGRVDELSAAEALAGFREANELYQGPSFPTISGAGPNGAIVHYRVSERTSRRLENGSLYLVDSGGQYLDGTTDVTRTVAVGAPNEEQRRCFTAVLKGHIALARAGFPEGTTGSQLDVLARLPLWRIGLDYDHGTGHGVGSYLSVHEGPQRIAKTANGVALRPGMIISNEPGYYKSGAFGIRIENLVSVVARAAEPGTEHGSLGFETLTLAPIDRALIDADSLSDSETAWLNGYHRRVCESLFPLVDADTAAWLARATEPIGREFQEY